MAHANGLLVSGPVLLIALAIAFPPFASAIEPTTSSSADPLEIAASGSSDDPAASAPDPVKVKKDPLTYQRLINELEAERRHVDMLEREVKELQSSNAQLQQTTTNLSTSDRQLVTQSGQFQTQITDIQKTVSSQLGPFGFGDRINSFLGQHTFTMVGGVSAGFYFDRKSAMNQPAFDFEVNPMIRLNDWIQFYASIGASVEPGDGISALGPSLANLQIFPFGQDQPLELVAGLFDIPFGDWYENQSPNWVNPFITAPLVFGAEAIVPPASIGLQARGGIQWGQLGQDFDYTVWVDAGPSFESAPGVSSIPAPVVGEAVNPLTGTNLATNGRGIGGRFRFYPLPIEREWGRLELMATTYNGKWLDGLWYNSWGLGYAYRVGAFRTRGEWAQSYRQMPTLAGAATYPGCCGHDNRQGWYVQFGYFLYGVPHPDLGDWLGPRFNKTEVLVRYSGVNQSAILANDISAVPVFGFNGSPAVFSPHAREVALALDYWIAPSIVWMAEVDFELPRSGGTLYNFGGSSSIPTATRLGPISNDVAVMTQLAIGF